MLEFDELRTEYQVPETLLNNMRNCGYIYPTPIQMQAIPVMLEVGQSFEEISYNQNYKYFIFIFIGDTSDLNRADKYWLALRQDQEKLQHFYYP